MGKIKKVMTSNFVKNAQKLHHLHIGKATLGDKLTSWQFFIKSNMYLSYVLTTALLSDYSRKIKIDVHTHTHKTITHGYNIFTCNS